MDNLGYSLLKRLVIEIFIIIEIERGKDFITESRSTSIFLWTSRGTIIFWC